MGRGNRVSPDEWKQGIYDSFDKVRTHTEPYMVEVGKFEIVVLPDVFSPKYFTDSLWFAEELPKIVKTRTFLEVGTGTGLIALYCAAAGATVTATDINPAAWRNTWINAGRFGLAISIRYGDMYAAIGTDEKFDFIFWNHPFNNWDTKPDMLLRAGIDPNYEGLSRYVREGKSHLTQQGALLLGTSDMAQTEEIEKIAAENNYRLTLLKSAELPIEDGSDVLNTYLIYRFDPD